MTAKINLLILAFTLGALNLIAQKGDRSVILTGGKIYTATGKTIENGAIGIKGNSIAFIGKPSDAIIAEYERAENLEGKHVYPGLIATNTTLGLTEIFSVRATRDYREVGDMNPNVRSIIAYNAESDITTTVVENGVLFAQICPRGGTISGTTSLVKLKAWNWEDAAYKMDEGIMMDWPRMFKRKGEREDPREFQPDGKYAKRIQELEEFFLAAKSYTKTKYPSERDLRLEAMRGIFNGSKRLYIEADFIKEIREVIAFKRRFELPKITIIGGYEADMVAELLAENDISILVRRVISLPRMAEDHIDAPFLLPSKLAEAGVTFAFQMDGDMEPIQNRNLAFAAGIAIANGLDREVALQSLTIHPAEILGVDDRTGSLEVGKEANFIITEGDLFDIRTGTVLRHYLQGELIDPENRQTTLYKKYLRKYGLPEVE
ncbi:MAG: amidohydrolase family protein [Flavobacteriales bacterium]|nr:amidohydrolase family protein [Flavobacteriales bacterium]